MRIKNDRSRDTAAARAAIDIGRTALIVVDMQNDFCHDDGASARHGLDVKPTQEMAPRLVALVEAARAAGLMVIYLANMHDEWSDSASWPARFGTSSLQICRTGSWGAAFYAVSPGPDERVVPKHRYNGFVGTDLDLILRAHGIATLLFTGVATNICVETTARDAFVRDYRVVMIRDCLAGSSVAEHDASLRTLERYFNATVLDAEQAAAALAGGGAKTRRGAQAAAETADADERRHRGTGRSGPISAKIVIKGLHKTFKTRRGRTEALGGIDLTIGDSEFLCIVGPSGCGKTTLLRILAGLETQTSGEVTIARDGQDRPLNSMVFQEHSLFPWMTVLDNAAFGLEMRGMAKRERYDKVMAFLEVVGLTRFRDHYPNQLSGGMKQRVSLVRAFVTDPEVLLMDEPFAALDAQNKVMLQDELVRIWEASRKTVVYITHSIEEALALGDRIVVMTSAPGRLKETIDVGFQRPRDIFQIRATPEFGAITARIWNVLETEVRKAREAQQ